MRLDELASKRGEAIDFQSLRFDYVPVGDRRKAAGARHPVVIVGAGPVGLALAIDLAQREIPVVLLDNDDTLSTGSRAICFAKRTLEIFDRLGCGDQMLAKGVSWSAGRVFFRDAEIYNFNLLDESGHARPAFINLQQYYVEGYLAMRAAELPPIDLRWKNKVTGLVQHATHATLTIDTPDGPFELDADHVVACDGSRSTLRGLVGQESEGRIFRDRFLIADVKMKMDRPAERWFWFDPSFHRNQSVLLHMQPDNVWRIDFQLGWDADPEVEKRPENIIPRVKALLAHSTMKDAEFEVEWASVYTFACTRMRSFRHGRVLFAGDAAHGVSPFGARGANSGVQDADNLGWKLALVIGGVAPEALLETYSTEREHAADENIVASTRATDFITPKSEISHLFRDAVLELSRHHPFARKLVNSGRLSVPATLDHSVLNTPDSAHFEGRMRPGAAAVDAPLTRADGVEGWLLRELGRDFTLMVYGDARTLTAAMSLLAEADGIAPLDVLHVQPCEADAHSSAAQGAAGVVDVVDHEGLIAERYDMLPGTVYLLRPDQHVCARWRKASPEALRGALRRAMRIGVVHQAVNAMSTESTA